MIARNKGDNEEVSLKRKKGKNLKFDLRAKTSKQPSVSFKAIDNMKTTLKLSGKKTLLFNQGLRAITNNRKIVPPNYKQHLVERTKTESDFFTITPITLKADETEEEDVQKSVDVVHVRNLQEYIDHVINERNYGNNRTLVKLLGDTGGDFFKVSMSIINLDKVSEDINTNTKKSRTTYKDEPFHNDFKDNGVNKILLVATCTKTKEDYEMVSKVFNLLDLNITGSKLIVTGKNCRRESYKYYFKLSGRSISCK